ncbi:FHA domain-containing protein [Streptomyces sp. NPDC046942]|uniref:FHA domain-containing protein n=1 Tax=Streptomyces sp. NPDC046942 TaxID=3155137 RepID=UPI0033E862A8
MLSLGAPAAPEPHPELDDAPTQLHVVAGPDAGGVHLLHGGRISVGRSADADVPLDDPDVSRLHCAVTVGTDGRVSVVDLGSTNGTTLDGVRVGERPVRVPAGGLLRIGESALRVTPAGGPGARVRGVPDGEGCVRVGLAGGSGDRPSTDSGFPPAPVRVSSPGGAGGPGGGQAPSAGAGAGTGLGAGGLSGAGGASGAGRPGGGRAASAGGDTASGAGGPGSAGVGGHSGAGGASDGGGPGSAGVGALSDAGGSGRGGGTSADAGAWSGGGGAGRGQASAAAGGVFGGGPRGSGTTAGAGGFGAGQGSSAGAGGLGGGQEHQRAESALVPGQGGAPRIESASGAGSRAGAGTGGDTHAGRFGVGGGDVPQGARRRGLGRWARRLAGGRSEQTGGEEPYGAQATRSPGAVPAAGAPPQPEAWPDPAALLLTALGPGPRLWERGPGHPEALTVRLGTADRSAPDGSGLVPAVPVTAALREAGSLGLAGPRPRLSGLARAVLAQLAALHSPDLLEIVLISADRSRPVAERTAEWSWLGWLPHVRPGHGQDCRLLLAYDREQAAARTEELLRRLDDHAATARTTAHPTGTPAPGTGVPSSAATPGTLPNALAQGSLPGTRAAAGSVAGPGGSATPGATSRPTAAGTPAAPAWDTAPDTQGFTASGSPSDAPGRSAHGSPAGSRDLSDHAPADRRMPGSSAPGLLPAQPTASGHPGAPAQGAVSGHSGAPGHGHGHAPDASAGAPVQGTAAGHPNTPTASTHGTYSAATPHHPPANPTGPTSPTGPAGHIPQPPADSAPARRPSWAKDTAEAPGTGGFPGPYTIVVVDGDPGGAALREALARLAVAGPRVGVHVVSLAETETASAGSAVAVAYEAACAVTPTFRHCGAVALLGGDVATGLHVMRVAPSGPVGPGVLAGVDAVSGAWAERFARALAPLRPDGPVAGPHARVATPLPQSARLLDELGLARATPASLMARWADAADDTQALGGRARAVLGAGPRGPLTADLVADGPHLLIEGPAGSGRTELLRAVVASLAAAERPDRLGIVLIDGRDGVGTGAGRGEGLRVCTDIPHVTTHLIANDPVRMREFAQSLAAELKRRAELLGRSDFAEWHAGRALSGRIVAQRTSSSAATSASASASSGDIEAPASSTLRLRPGAAARQRADAIPPLPRLAVVVDDLDALVTPALGSPGRPAAGSVMRALEAVAREGARLGVHLVAAAGTGGRTAETEPARRATLRVALVAPASGPDEPAPGRGQLAYADGRVTGFQAGRVTGRIPRTATQRPTVVPLDWARMGDPPARRPVRELGNGPTDLALLASAVERAAREVSAARVPSLL